MTSKNQKNKEKVADMKIELSIFALLLYSVYSMKSYEFCKKMKKCVGSYDQQNMYEEKCGLEKCSAFELKYDCGNTICAKTKLACRQLRETQKIVETIMIPYSRSLERNNLRKYVANFMDCPLTKGYLKSTDVCINGKNCFYALSKANQTKKYNMLISCPCRGEHSYHCSDYYCATSSIACDLVVQNKFDRPMSFMGCLNDDTILNKLK